MGLLRRSDRARTWSVEEDQLLEQLIGNLPPTQIAKRLGRTVNAVVIRANRIGLSRQARDGWYTKREVCEILGMGHRWVQARIGCGALKAEPFDPDSTPSKTGQAHWRIDREDLRKFIRRYPDELNGWNVDLVQLVEILVGLPAPIVRS
jgi:hypothetical protein